MSTLVVSNISDGTTTVGASYVTNGSAKAWVNFNGTGTIAARDSLNLSSLTDNGTGHYSVNLTSSMASTSCVPTVNGKQQDIDSFNDNGLLTAVRFVSSSSYKQYCRQSHYEVGSERDFVIVTSSIQGDLA